MESEPAKGVDVTHGKNLAEKVSHRDDANKGHHWSLPASAESAPAQKW